MTESKVLELQTERKAHKYFVVCENLEYSGAVLKSTHQIDSDDKITDIQQIFELQGILESQGNYRKVLIVDWKLFET